MQGLRHSTNVNYQQEKLGQLQHNVYYHEANEYANMWSCNYMLIDHIGFNLYTCTDITWLRGNVLIHLCCHFSSQRQWWQLKFEKWTGNATVGVTLLICPHKVFNLLPHDTWWHSFFFCLSGSRHLKTPHILTHEALLLSGGPSFVFKLTAKD